MTSIIVSVEGQDSFELSPIHLIDASDRSKLRSLSNVEDASCPKNKSIMASMIHRIIKKATSDNEAIFSSDASVEFGARDLFVHFSQPRKSVSSTVIDAISNNDSIYLVDATIDSIRSVIKVMDLRLATERDVPFILDASKIKTITVVGYDITQMIADSLDLELVEDEFMYSDKSDMFSKLKSRIGTVFSIQKDGIDELDFSEDDPRDPIVKGLELAILQYDEEDCTDLLWTDLSEAGVGAFLQGAI